MAYPLPACPAITCGRKWDSVTPNLQSYRFLGPEVRQVTLGPVDCFPILLDPRKVYMPPRRPWRAEARRGRSQNSTKAMPVLPTPGGFWTLRQVINKVDIQECRVVEITLCGQLRPRVLTTPGKGCLRSSSSEGGHQLGLKLVPVKSSVHTWGSSEQLPSAGCRPPEELATPVPTPTPRTRH